MDFCLVGKEIINSKSRYVEYIVCCSLYAVAIYCTSKEKKEWEMKYLRMQGGSANFLMTGENISEMVT